MLPKVMMLDLELEKVPVIFVVGDREVSEQESLSVQGKMVIWAS